MRVCIDFRDLNRATPMDGYPMPVADLLVDAAAGHKVISFMDGNAGVQSNFYGNRRYIVDSLQMSWTYRPFEWIVMIWVENACATYQRAMNYIFHELIGKIVEIYIDDVVIKSLDHKTFNGQSS
jgi:hypothetical protein